MTSIADKLGLGPSRVETKCEDGTWIIETKAPEWSGYRGPPSRIKLTADQYRRYRLWRDHGETIQSTLPELSGWQREELMTGIVD